MRIRFCSLVSTGLLLAAMSFAAPSVALAAAEAPTVPAPGGVVADNSPHATDASLKEAHAMSDMLNITAQTHNILQAMRNQMIQATMQASGKPVDEAAKIVDEVLLPDFNAALPELSDALLLPWAVNFSAADLKTLHDFYATPTGERLLKTMPVINQQTVRASQAWGQRTFQAATKAHADELHARGLKF